MTDEPVQQTTADGKSPFQIVPTIDGFLELAGRVDHLEASIPATGDDPDTIDDDGLADVHARLDRHREELEEIKRRYNALIRYIGASQLPPAPAVSSQDTIQPGMRNLIQ